MDQQPTHLKNGVISNKELELRTITTIQTSKQAKKKETTKFLIYYKLHSGEAYQKFNRNKA